MVAHVRVHGGATNLQSLRIWGVARREVANRAFVWIVRPGKIRRRAGCLRFHCPKRQSHEHTSDRGEGEAAEPAKQLRPV